MKDNKIINLIEPSKKSPKESTKRKICIYEKLTRLPKNGDFKVKQKKLNHVDFVTIQIILRTLVPQNLALVRY